MVEIVIVEIVFLFCDLNTVITLMRCSSLGRLKQIAFQIRAFLSFDRQFHQGYASELWPKILDHAFPHMSTMRLEDKILIICERAIANQESKAAGLLHFVEFASGRGNLSKALLRKGLTGAAFDIIYSELHDCLSPAGFRLWLVALSAMTNKGLCWFGTKCSSWVLLCLAQSNRRPENMYWGDTAKEFVQNGNALMAVTSFLYFIGRLLGHYCILEQPKTSCMPLVSLMASVLKYFHCFKCDTYLRSYGSASQKPVQLIGNDAKLKDLEREMPMNCGSELCTRDEDGGFTGKKDELHESEVYPVLFGEAVADFFMTRIRVT